MKVRSIHHSLGWIAGVVAVLWAATGFLHPVMTWTAPRPAVQAPPSAAIVIAGLAAPRGALPAQVSLLRRVEHDGRAYWQSMSAAGVIAIDAETGAPAPDLPAQRAVSLARHYAGVADEVAANATRIDRFSTHYPPVNKLLPVWEVRFETPEGLALYVEPGADRLAMTTNDLRRAQLALFQNVHTLKFLEGIEPLRVTLIALLVGSVLVTTLFGMTLLIGARGRGARLWHRRLAWVAAPFVVAFTASGLFHLFVTSAPAVAPTAPAFFDVAALKDAPRLAGVDRADVSVVGDANGAPLWRVLPEGASAALYFDAEGRTLALDDAARARQIAGADASAAATPVTRFSATYGFVNKRLPVMQVGEGDHAAFIDLREGIVAARATPGVVAFEAGVFDTIHKWEPVADVIGRRNRDYLTMIAVALIAVMASFGLVLAAKRRRKGEG